MLGSMVLGRGKFSRQNYATWLVVNIEVLYLSSMVVDKFIADSENLRENGTRNRRVQLGRLTDVLAICS